VAGACPTYPTSSSPAAKALICSGPALKIPETSTSRPACMNKPFSIATMQDFLLRKALKNAGLAYNKVKIIVLKPPEMLQALINKNIDAFIAWEPYPSQAETGGNCRTLISSSSIWKDHPCCVVIADAVFYEKYPLKIEKFIQAHALACKFIQNNVEESILIGQKYTGMDKKTVKKAVSMIKYESRLDIDKAVQFVDFLNNLRYIKVQNKPRSIKTAFIK